MKASELRIGNFIKCNHHEHPSETAEVHSVNGDNTVRFYLGGRSIGCFKLSWCEPIPLTEEWLVKLGFTEKERGRDHKSILINKKYCIVAINNEDSISFYPEGLYNYCIEVQYVHQLQNTYFALEGEELTISDESPYEQPIDKFLNEAKRLCDQSKK